MRAFLYNLKNEKGNPIHMLAYEKDNLIHTTVQGPDSRVENIWTLKEARELYRLLGRVLGHVDGNT